MISQTYANPWFSPWYYNLSREIHCENISFGRDEGLLYQEIRIRLEAM